MCFARSAWAGLAAAGASVRTPSGSRAGGVVAAGCSLAILFSNPRNLRLRRKPDPLSLGPFDPQSASADWGSIFYI